MQLTGRGKKLCTRHILSGQSGEMVTVWMLAHNKHGGCIASECTGLKLRSKRSCKEYKEMPHDENHQCFAQNQSPNQPLAISSYGFQRSEALKTIPPTSNLVHFLLRE